jgi:hypothetical protein
MKNRLIILLIAAAVSLSSHAATCPPIAQLDPENLPMGWSMLIPPQLEDQTYHFGKAVHSLNMNFFYGQILCTYEAYETCPTFLCPMFVIVSDEVYEQPTSTAAPWNTRPQVVSTLVCQPANHDPSVCVFE